MAAVEIASAYVTLLPSAKGMQAAIAADMNGPAAAAGAASGGKFSGGFSTAAKVGVAGVGIALVKGVADAMDQNQIGANIAATLGLDAASSEAQRYGDIAGRLYRDAWGDSLDEVAGAVTATVTSLPDLDMPGVETMTQKALALSDALGVDVAESAGLVSTLLGSGLITDAEHGIDVLTASLQQVPEALRGEIVDAGNEYSQFFNQLGFDAEQAFGVLVTNSADGQYGIDKAGDAIKEFTLRATDMSAKTTGVFDTIGLDSTKMANDLLAGGDSANAAFNQIIDGLLGIDDPATQAQAAIALFGTPLEDLGVDGIPTFLESLGSADGAMQDVEGSAQDLADTLGNTTQARFEKLKREGLGALADFAESTLIPAMEMLLPVLSEGLELFNKLPTPVKTAALAVGLFAVGAAAFAGPAAKMVSGIKAVSGAFTALAMNPWVLAIIAALALVYLAYTHWDTISAALVTAWNWVHEQAMTIWNAISAFFQQWWPFLVGVFLGPVGLIAALVYTHWDTIRSTTMDIWNGISSFLSGVLSSIAGFFDRWIISPVQRVMEVFGALPAAASAAWNGVSSAVESVADTIVGAIDRMREAASDALGPIGKVLDAGGGIIGGGLDLLGFDTGGVVPGPVGAPRLILAHGGETILPTHKAAFRSSLSSFNPTSTSGSSSGGSTVVHNDFRGLIVRDDNDLQTIVRAVNRDKRAQGRVVGGYDSQGLDW